jgi:hypothetical protein
VLDQLLASSPGAFAAAACVTFAARGGCIGGGGLRADEGLRRALDADDAPGADVITWLQHVYSLFAWLRARGLGDAPTFICDVAPLA